MGVASCRSTFLCLMLSVRLVPFRISIRDLIPFSGPRTSWVFNPRSGSTQPSPAQPSRPGPTRPCVPLAPNPPCAPSSPPSLIWISRATTSPLPLPPLSPRGALGFGDGDHRILDPEVSSPPLPFSPLSLPLPPLLPPARALLFPCPRAPLPFPARRGAAAPVPLLPARGGARPPPPAPPPGGGGGETRARRPCQGTAHHAGTRARSHARAVS
jgi:hypothetical protein